MSRVAHPEGEGHVGRYWSGLRRQDRRVWGCCPRLAAMRRLALACLALVGCAERTAVPASNNDAGIRARLSAIARQIDGRVAVTVLSLRTGERVSIEGGV